MHAVLCYGATERNGGRAEARLGLAECWRFMESNCRPLVEGVVGLHAAFTVSDETLREAGAIAREYGTVVHLHVAEDRCDVLDAQQRGYSGVIDRLLKTRALPCGSILAHGVHLTADEVRTCAAEGFWLVQNPRSNAKNGVGYAASLRESERVALGTDGFPADMLAEQEALRGEAAQHGDDPERAARRLDAGRLLAAELLPRVEAARAADLSARRLAEIRARAEAAALRLWRRMEEIGEP
ncbi:MAG: amidohydrolase family protein [Planctomycetes bacterium]|nr:amidohydrolase family protein [Planctomycetota bacterium]